MSNQIPKSINDIALLLRKVEYSLVYHIDDYIDYVVYYVMFFGVNLMIS